MDFNPFKRKFSAQEQEFFTFMRKNQLFKQLADHELVEFIPHLYLRTYKKDEVIFFRKDPSKAFYIIKSGKITLSIDIDDKIEDLETLSNSQSFGNNAFLQGGRRLFNAICTSETAEIYVLPQTNIFEIFDENVKIKARVLECLLEQFNQYNSNLFDAYRASFGFFDLGLAHKDINFS